MTLQTLVGMTCMLGEPHRDYVIIGEGNTSCRIDDQSFYVKASGQQMQAITGAGFVAVHFDPILDLLDNPPKTRTEQKERMMAARVEQDSALSPSIEVSFHGMLLHETGAKFVGHTHPTVVNQLLCSNHAEDFAQKRLFPDHVVLCGPQAAFVPYADPGLPLAIIMRERVRAFMDTHGEPPREILLANHGLIALGSSVQEVLNITAMCVKAAHTLVGALSVGQPVYMDAADVQHIHTRPDEIQRRNMSAED